MQWQINSNSENYFFISLYGKELIHEGQNVSLQSEPSRAFHYSDVRRQTSRGVGCKQFQAPYWCDWGLGIFWNGMSSEKLFQGRLSLFYPKTFLFRKKPRGNEKHHVLNQSDPGFLFRSAGWLTVRILHSEDKPGECCKIRSSILEERY